MSDQIKTPFNKLYEHISGEIFFLKANATHHKTGAEILILGSVENDKKQIWVELEEFYKKHPQTGVPRFQLITKVGVNK